ncbi:MAG TPA: hypothetical protein VHE34_17750 [Puia sp.]|uniref:hypothetical protein n=1 Tax=Puia sp. TaxID=2045100 RepID=UPI002B7260E9|nr:hypothetical protein [Puia sp.]HVU97081.1 hypothetical protein [Puia sp.]
MEIKLISGTFTVEEAELLLTAIVNTKIAFHENKIRTIHETEEDIEHSERRIMALQATLREAIVKMKRSGQTHTVLNAHIEVNTTPRIGQ